MIAALMVSSAAFAAGMEAEPYVGYGFLGTAGTASQFTANNNPSFSTLAVGLRANYKFDGGFYVGPDFSYHLGISATVPANGPVPAGTSLSGSLMKLGVNVGYDVMPSTLKVWAGYNFIDGNTLNGTYGVYGTINAILAGSSYKFGVGYHLTPNWILNAEYFIQNWGSVTGSESGLPTVPQNGNLLLVSVSMPFNMM